jgi:hypothetical protein
MTKVAISVGHGQKIRGARGNPVPPQVDEVDECKKMVDRVAELLGCVKYFDTSSTSQSQNLNAITNWHNKQTRDLDVSFHLNAYDHTAQGTEVLYLTQQAKAAEVCAAIVAAGSFTSRGAKKRTDLAFLNNTSKPAILLETFFCDHTGDSNKYHDRFEEICRAIAESISDTELGDQPPSRPDRPERPGNPFDVPLEDRPLISKGDVGPDVEDLQRMLPRFDGDIDGDFGPVTEDAVYEYQRSRGLQDDGIVGPNTWGALYAHTPPVPPPPPPPGAFTQAQQTKIKNIAMQAEIADYYWEDRGQAPAGYTKGMALAFAQSYRKLLVRHPALLEMSKVRTSSDKDVFQIYRSEFDKYHMSNESGTLDTDRLRHLYAFMLGSGMRESSGRHCEGRDQSATNVESTTAEAGLFQTSYNAHSASDPEFDDLMAEFSLPENEAVCYLDAFKEDVSCSSSEWSCYGSGDGYKFQELCKSCPAFAVESHGLTLRNLCNHYGPVQRGEVELMPEANEMFLLVQHYVDSITVVS